LTQGSFWRLQGKKLLIIGAFVSLLGAWAFGQFTGETDVETYLSEVAPEATGFALISSQAADGQYLFSALSGTTPAGYVTVAQGQGYAGPMTVLVAWTLDGKITNIQVPQHEETPAWYNRLYNFDYFGQYIGREFDDPFTLGEDVNAASGATRSSHGIAEGVYEGRLLLADHLGQPFVGPSQPIKIGGPEIFFLVGLGLSVLFRMTPALRAKRWPRYIMLVYGLAIFGIFLSAMLSLVNFAIFPIGFAPSPATNPLLYLMVFGVVGLALALGKNFWCFWMCPYCAMQEGAHFLGGGQVRPVSRRQLALRNSRYVILWVVLMLVFITRQPQLAVFEPWNTVFSLEGNLSQWLLVIATLGIGLFIYDFWCHYLCPVGATMDLVLKVRTWAVNTYGRLTKP
jgi:Na+-translocating ferredoxin:NAD+ oxidoreductase RnfG subunit